MLSIINAILDLWDPYNLYLFPKDEYTTFAIKIEKFIREHKDLKVDDLENFVFSIMPPINASNYEKIDRVEYERFAKLMFMVLN